MPLNPAIVVEVAPEFAADTRLASFLAKAERAHSIAPWGAVYADAMAYYAAHLLTRQKETAAASSAAAESAGGVTSRSAGDLAEGYGDASAGGTTVPDADVDLRTTRYGLAYLRLRGSRVATTATLITV